MNIFGRHAGPPGQPIDQPRLDTLRQSVNFIGRVDLCATITVPVQFGHYGGLGPIRRVQTIVSVVRPSTVRPIAVFRRSGNRAPVGVARNRMRAAVAVDPFLQHAQATILKLLTTQRSLHLAAGGHRQAGLSNQNDRVGIHIVLFVNHTAYLSDHIGQILSSKSAIDLLDDR